MPSKGVGADTCSEVESMGRLKCKKLDPEVVEGARRMRHEAAAPPKRRASSGLTRPPAPPRGSQRIVDSTAAAAAAADSTAAAPRSQPLLPAGVRERRASNATCGRGAAPGPRTRALRQSPTPEPRTRASLTSESSDLGSKRN
jgi:hypothetical protein